MMSGSIWPEETLSPGGKHHADSFRLKHGLFAVCCTTEEGFFFFLLPLHIRALLQQDSLGTEIDRLSNAEKIPHLHFHAVILKVLGHPAVTTVVHLGRSWSKQSKETNLEASKVDQTALALMWRCIRPDLLVYSHMQLLPETFWQPCGRFEAETDSSEKSAASNNTGLLAPWGAKQCRCHLISLFSSPDWKLTEEEKKSLMLLWMGLWTGWQQLCLVCGAHRGVKCTSIFQLISLGWVLLDPRVAVMCVKQLLNQMMDFGFPMCVCLWIVCIFYHMFWCATQNIK